MRKIYKRLTVIYAVVVGLVLVFGASAVAGYYLQLSERNELFAWGYLALITAGGLILLYWLFRGWFYLRTESKRTKRAAKAPSEMSEEEIRAEIEERLGKAGEIAGDEKTVAEMREHLSGRAERIRPKLESQTLEIAAFGTVNSGKSSVLNALAGEEVFASDLRAGTTTVRNEIPWPGADRVVLIDTPGLNEIGGAERERIAVSAARDADLILFVVEGTLRSFEMEALTQLKEALHKRILLVMNKEDWYTPAERESLIAQLREAAAPLVDPGDVIAVRAKPAARVRTRVLPGGEEVEEEIEQPADISALASKMLKVVQKDGRDLLLANLLLRARGLVDESRAEVREALDKRAREIIRGTMWKAGIAAAVNPVPVADIGIAMGILGKMGLDLARVYHRDVDLGDVESILGRLRTIAAAGSLPSVAGSAIKGFPGFGTLAGGIIQGLTQTVLARWAGRTLMQYFRSERELTAAELESVAKSEWRFVTQPVELNEVIQEGLARLRKDEPKA